MLSELKTKGKSEGIKPDHKGDYKENKLTPSTVVN